MSFSEFSTDSVFRDISPETYTDLEQSLGPDGLGVCRLGSILKDEFRLQLIDEMNDPTRVRWWDAGDVYVNHRGVKIVQNHDVYALKLSAGNQGPIDDVPSMTRLTNDTQSFVQSLSSVFPSLDGWTADEMSYHKYYDRDVGLSYHRDNARFVGLIAVVALAGECDFKVIDRQPASWIFDKKLGKKVVSEWLVNYEHSYTTKPGDMVLTRATGLYAGMTDDDRPEHAVMNVRSIPRVSFMLRDNRLPLNQDYGFTYYNWPD